MENVGISLGKKTLSGTFWVYTAFYSGKFMVFLSTIILARLLDKDDFGVAGYALVVTGFLDVLADLGIGQALIYLKTDEKSSSTGFWLGLIVGVFLFLLTWLAGPLIGEYFNDPRAIPVTRVLALTFPISALGNVHSALLSKELQFKRKFVPEFVQSFSKGLIAIPLALLNFGPWSLIIAQLGGTAAGVVAFWIMYPWRPSFSFSPVMAVSMLKYGVNIVGVSTLSFIQGNTPSFLVGRYLGAAMLGVYQLAFRVPDLLIGQLCSMLSRVIFPVYATIQDDLETLRKGFLIATRYLSLITVPIGVGLALVAQPFVLVLFSSKWENAIPVVQAIAFYSTTVSLSFSAGSVYKAIGRPNILSRVSLIEVIYEVPLFVWVALTFPNINAIAWSLAILSLTTTTLELSVSSWVLKMPFFRILKALAPAFLGSAVMSAGVIGILALTSSFGSLIRLVAGILAGAVCYVGSLWLFQRQLVKDTIEYLVKAFRRGK